MIKNYFLVAWRLIRKNKVFSAINIFGLSTGIACCILITLYIQDEFNYEKGFFEQDKIFRINTTWTRANGQTETSPTTSPPIAIDIANELPDVDIATRVVDISNEQHIIKYNDKTFFEKKAFLVDSNFLDVFRYKLIEGDPVSALQTPSSLLISGDLSKRIFGNHSAIDELLIIHSGESTDTFRITGVIETPDYPSHLDAHLYMSMNSNGTGEWILTQTTWADNNMVGSYIKLQDPDLFKTVESKLPALVERHAGEILRSSGRKKTLTLQPLNEVRLYSGHMRPTGSEFRSSITYIKIIATIGIFILLLACVNFMNLTTAKSTQRAGEVGIRKSMGAYKGNLIRQFLGESMVIVFLALLLSVALVTAALPTFNAVMQKALTLNATNLPLIIAAAFIICIVTALLAGSYPAFFLSSFKPTEVLKGKSLTADGSRWIRRGLVVSQFVITITLISSIVIIRKQVAFMQTKSLGFDTEQVVLVPFRTPEASDQYATLKSEFEQLAGVKSVSASSSIPSTPLTIDWGIYKKGTSNDQTVKVHVVRVDKDYFKTLDIELVTGRDFLIEQDNLATDTLGTTKVIVNEAALAAFDIPVENAIGSALIFQPEQEAYEFTIIGVIKDFHQFSLHREIVPMMFFLPSSRNSFRYLTAAIDMKSFDQIEDQMKAIWSKSVNSTPFESIFLNDNIKRMYIAEKRTSTILMIAATIAMIISCLGLYGLSVYVAERRIKEIGVRKIIGASVGSILSMLSLAYVKLIGIALFISIPLGYYFMNKWLESFAYKITPDLTVFVISGLVALVLGWLTVSFESFRAASRNPVETLRSN